MDASARNSSSSKPSRRSPSSRGNERDENDQEMGFGSQNPKKPVAKNFMSPTVSATSKAALPKKKVLGEINRHPGSISGAHPPKAPISDSNVQKKIQTLEQKFPEKAPISESKANLDNQDADCFKEETLSLANKSEELSFEYDPVKNYLSPRPQFLRYNPNRRIEISQRLEMEAGTEDEVSSSSVGVESEKDSDEEDGTVKSKSSLTASLLECHSDVENGEFEESEDEVEEEEEVKGWGVKGLLKSVLVFVLLVLSTSYISSMNSFVDEKGAEMSVLGLNHTVRDVEIDEISRNVDLGKVVGMDAIAAFGLEDCYAGGSMELVGGDAKEDGETESASEADMVENVEGREMVSRGEVSEQIMEDIETKAPGTTMELVGDAKQEGESEDVSEVEMIEGGVGEREMVSSGEVSDQLIEDVESKATATMENDKCVSVDLASVIFDGILSQYGMSTAMEEENEYMVIAEASEIIGSTESTTENAIESQIEREAMVEKENLLEGVQTEISPQITIGVLVCCVLFASLISVLHIKRRSRKATKDSSSSTVKVAFLQPPTAKKSSLEVLPHERQEHTMPLNSVPNSTLLIISKKEDIKESSGQSRAPTVQLLGEFAVEEINSSLRSLDIKSRIKEGNQVGSFSVSDPKINSASKVFTSPTHAKSDFPESSVTMSTPQGSFNSETKNLKNQLKNNKMDGEDTPLRRSARIRSRAVSYS